MSQANWQREVEELHAFFQLLFSSEVESLRRAEDALATDFTMLGPDGSVSTRDEILAMLGNGRGRAPELAIEVEAPRTVVATDALIVGEYVEVHRSPDSIRRRRTTAVFDVDPGGPNGVRWRHAHETWLPSE